MEPTEVQMGVSDWNIFISDAWKEFVKKIK